MSSALFTALSIAFFVSVLEGFSLKSFLVATFVAVPLYVFLSFLIRKIMGVYIEKRVYSLYGNVDSLEARILIEGKVLSTVLLILNVIITVFVAKAFV